jgi:hypothetical protein
MYFTAPRDNRNGMPSRITIHNTPLGTYTILLIGAGSSNGYFAGKGTTSGSKKYRWEVTATTSNVTVLWDGKNVRPGR